MKPADRSKLFLTIGAAGVIVGLGTAINSWQNQGKILPPPTETSAAAFSVSTATAPAVTGHAVTEPAVPAASKPLTPEMIDKTFEKITQRLIATIDNQKKLDSVIEEENKASNEDPLAKKAIFSSLSSRQNNLRDDAGDIIDLMQRLRHEAAIPTAKKALNTAYDHMGQAAKLLRSISADEAMDQEHEAIRNMEIAFTIVSQR